MRRCAVAVDPNCWSSHPTFPPAAPCCDGSCCPVFASCGLLTLPAAMHQRRGSVLALFQQAVHHQHHAQQNACGSSHAARHLLQQTTPARQPAAQPPALHAYHARHAINSAQPKRAHPMPSIGRMHTRASREPQASRMHAVLIVSSQRQHPMQASKVRSSAAVASPTPTPPRRSTRTSANSQRSDAKSAAGMGSAQMLPQQREWHTV